MEAAKVARGRADLDFDHTPWSSDRSLAAESLRSGLSANRRLGPPLSAAGLIVLIGIS
jgi:hypothetical protein